MRLRVRIAGREYHVEVGDLTARPVQVSVDGTPVEVWPEADTPRPSPPTSPEAARPSASPVRPAPAPIGAETGTGVRAPIPGVILSIHVQPGSLVDAGQELCVLEAMKMRNTIRAARAGRVAAVHVAVGQHVAHNDLLLEFAE